ncbi:MAG: hypothetical protein K2I81_01435 [Alphaproteobacteria bacterium]|nr:hypothetical protein [Alphaproteobacteria bacterium]
MALHKTEAEKRRAFRAAAAAGAVAWDARGREYPLRTLKIKDVEYVAGAWRLQNKFDGHIQLVRGEEYVLDERLNRVESNHFEFYNARLVGINCYGRFTIAGAKVIVAKYETDDETHWAYGNTLEQARAFLGISLYDKYRDLIHSAACKKKLSRSSK